MPSICCACTREKYFFKTTWEVKIAKYKVLYLLKKKKEQVHCLDIFVIKLFVWSYICKISKQIFKGHVTDMMSVLWLFYRFLLKLRCFYFYFCYFLYFKILISLFLHFGSQLSILTVAKNLLLNLRYERPD